MIIDLEAHEKQPLSKKKYFIQKYYHAGSEIGHAATPACSSSAKREAISEIIEKLRASYRKKREVIDFPTSQHPEYNFAGAIIGPRGVTKKKIEKDTGVTLTIGSYDRAKEKSHVTITADTDEQVEKAKALINPLLVPAPHENQHKTKGLRQLAEINGTLIQPNNATMTKNKPLTWLYKKSDPDSRYYDPKSRSMLQMECLPPSRKAKEEDTSEWKVPPVVSYWKNSPGFIIPLGQRLKEAEKSAITRNSISSTQSNRRKRLREFALETVDKSTDPYWSRNQPLGESKTQGRGRGSGRERGRGGVIGGSTKRDGRRQLVQKKVFEYIHSIFPHLNPSLGISSLKFSISWQKKKNEKTA